MRLLVASVMLLVGCDRVFGLERRDDAGAADAKAADASDANDPPDARELCFGRNASLEGGLFEACVAVDLLPSRLDTANGVIDTAQDCTRVVVQTDAAQTEVCIVAAEIVNIDAVLRVIGPRPLVLVATDTLAISGTLDASSRRGSGDGPGGGVASCAGGPGDNDGNGGGGGGAGGSFGSQAGGGAAGSSGGVGGLANAASDPPTFVRAGCRGGKGGDSSAGPLGGASGAGGGGVYLIAGNEILIEGRVNVSGAAGDGGQNDSSGRGTGGGGGGSGGVIGLDAPAITIASTAILIANGGGGGGGGGTSTPGQAGGEPDLDGVPPFGAQGGSGGGGNGATGLVEAGSGASAGGGGGGGRGFIHLYGMTITVDPLAVISPPPSSP